MSRPYVGKQSIDEQTCVVHATNAFLGSKAVTADELAHVAMTMRNSEHCFDVQGRRPTNFSPEVAFEFLRTVYNVPLRAFKATGTSVKRVSDLTDAVKAVTLDEPIRRLFATRGGAHPHSFALRWHERKWWVLDSLGHVLSPTRTCAYPLSKNVGVLRHCTLLAELPAATHDPDPIEVSDDEHAELLDDENEDH